MKQAYISWFESGETKGAKVTFFTTDTNSLDIFLVGEVIIEDASTGDVMNLLSMAGIPLIRAKLAGGH